MRTWLAIALALSALSADAAADVIHYRDGRTLEGLVLARNEAALTLETRLGTIDVDLADVAWVEERLTPGQLLSQRLTEVPADNGPALFILYEWAAQQKLRAEAKDLLQRVLTLEPDHAGANEALGRVRIEGSWYGPLELEAYLAEVGEHKREQGLVLFEGRWVAEADANKRMGLDLFEGEWIPRREAHARGALAALSELGGWSTSATEGQYVTIFSDLDEGSLEYLVYDLDAAVADFLRRADPSDAERSRLTKYDVAIFILPDHDVSTALIDGGFYKRYPVFDDLVQRWAGLNAFGMNWPRPFLVLVEGPHLEMGGDPDAARTGLLSHQLGRLFIDRFKGSRSAPGWVIPAMSAFYEGATTYYQTVSISTRGIDADGQPIGHWVDNWQHYGEWRDNLRDESVQASLPNLQYLLGDSEDGFDSKSIGICWSFLRFLLEKHRSEFFTYLRAFDSNPFSLADDLRVEHQRAWDQSFALTVPELQQAWQNWALAQPARFPTDELDR